MTALGGSLRRARDREDGSATVEFVILVPVFLILFMSSFELGMLLTRQVMLDRALDLAVREVRLGRVDFAALRTAPAQHDALKDLICANAMMEDCRADLQLEMRPLDPRGWSMIDADADCVDRAATSAPVPAFSPGAQNELVVLRACALFDPFFPTTGLGAQLERQDGGDAYALVSSSAYVVEPTE